MVVRIAYATFQPGCLTLTLTDKAAAERSATEAVAVEPGRRSDVRRVDVKPRPGWSRDLVLTARAFERSCDGAEVASETQEVQVPEKGSKEVSLSLQAEDSDEDGYVSPAQGGTDCDDVNPAIRPDATELCNNGRDDNCTAGESDAPGTALYYVDADSDGFGSPERQLLSCAPVAGYVANNRDCDDSNPSVRPDQAETLCDGQDENCNEVPDDTFAVGAACTTSQGCAGTIACQSTTLSTCMSSQAPSSWFVDSDGDQRAGTAAGTSCAPPVPGAVAQSTDCDETSPFVFNGATERCDRLDNNCDGRTDEGCATRDWQALSAIGISTWRAVTSYAENKAWVAGSDNALAHIEGTNVTRYTDCPGNWVSAWANPADGRVFLGSEQGELATRALGGGTGCTIVPSGRFSAINGLIGFSTGATTTLFAVTSEGRVFRWEYAGTGTGTVTTATQAAANLRAIHGTSPTNLVAVGAELVSSVPQARAFGTNPATGAWRRETLPSLPPDMFLRGVHMAHGQLAYAAGDEGVVLQRANGEWSLLPPLPSSADAQDVAAYGRTALYVISVTNKSVYYFNGISWLTDYTASWTPSAIDGVGPHDLWVAGSQGSVLHRGP